MSPTKVKICGLTQLADAELAVSLGAWALGMIFYESSPRRCSLEQARLIVTALRRKAELCGVFVNAPLEQVERTVDELGLTMVQLHGDEGPAFCDEIARRTGVGVIKAVQVADAGDVRDVERFRNADYHLLDARSSRAGRQAPRGGTGETFDWSLLAVRRSKIPLILGGGLTPENVEDAIGAARPFALDTASGTELAPGRKDPERLRAFFAAVARADAPAGTDAPAGVDDAQVASTA